MPKHAILSPSGADRWMTCPGSVILSLDIPRTSSAASEEGTNYHDLAALCLNEGKDAAEFVGQPFADESLVTEENADYLQVYLDQVRELHAQGGHLLVEQSLPISQITGEKEAIGTIDCAIIREDEVVIDDLKFGRGVAVKAEGNRQTRIYAISVLDKHELWETVKRIRIIICQPRVMDGITEEVLSVDELKLFRDEVAATARPIIRALAMVPPTPLPFHPSEKACKFCPAKAVCPELTKTVEQATSEGFEDLTQPVLSRTGEILETPADRLGKAMRLADLCEIFMHGVRVKAESELLAGRSVTGFKLVQGRKGNRKWTNEETITEMMKKWRMKKDDMYKYTLITPSVAEKKLKKEHPSRWEELAALVSQSEGALSVAPVEDPRPEAVLAAATDGFHDETAGPSEDELLKDLL